MHILIEEIVWHTSFFKSQSTTGTIQADARLPFSLISSIPQRLFIEFLLSTYYKTLLRNRPYSNEQ